MFPEDAASLRQVCDHVVIVAHDEDTGQLRLAIENEGFSYEEVRGPYPEGAERWAGILRCLANHANAWKIARERAGYTIIVEADFVPVRAFGSLPFPFDREAFPGALGYLYACGPQLWDLRGGLRGHAGGCVAYVVSAETAALMIDYAEEVLRRPDTTYAPWDSSLGYWLNRRGIQTFVPYRNYGEHGGVPNPEHRAHGLRATHRADLLYRPLVFLPAYARGSRPLFWLTRTRARLWGVARLACGRYISLHDVHRAPSRSRLLRVAIGRQVSRRGPASPMS